MGPVPGTGARTPCLVSGPGAARYADAMEPLGTPVTDIGPEPGTAATRKLLRSVFMKGIAAAAIESLAAAQAAGCEPWMQAELEGIFDTADAALLERLLSGSRAHAVRRIDEVDAAADMLRELGVEPHIARAAGGRLRELARETQGGAAHVG
jgi:3-hydroxyisobutyrate dehydrogenase-like beta-hydroxyacid dehydrogenase